MNNNFSAPCNKCKYFVRYYRKMDTKFFPMLAGHCKKRSLTAREHKMFPFPEGCDMWEEMPTDNAERKQAIEDVIKQMSDRLDEILEVLKSDDR